MLVNVLSFSISFFYTVISKIIYIFVWAGIKPEARMLLCRRSSWRRINSPGDGSELETRMHLEKR